MTKYTRDGVEIGSDPLERRYVALKNLAFGDRIIKPGELVPVEMGRNYGSMLYHRQIAAVHEPGFGEAA